MNVYDLTTQQLKRAAAIKEQIDRLSKELRSIFGAPANPRAVQKKNQSMSASTKTKIATAQRARWANLRRAKATRSVKPAAKAKKKRMAPAARAKLSAKLKAYWAKKKAAKK
jgi:prophage DNA circulation protein